MRLKNMLGCFTDFSFDDLSIDEQEFEDYKSKYLDIYDKVRTGTEKEKVSILDDIDFEVELLSRDVINVRYIIALLQRMRDSAPQEQERQRKEILKLIDGETKLRSKKELISQFISEHMYGIPRNKDVEEAFDEYWTGEREKALEEISEEENLKSNGMKDIVDNYLFTEKEPLSDEIISIMETRPKLKERSSATKRILQKFKDFIETYIDGIE